MGSAAGGQPSGNEPSQQAERAERDRLSFETLVTQGKRSLEGHHWGSVYRQEQSAMLDPNLPSVEQQSTLFSHTSRLCAESAREWAAGYSVLPLSRWSTTYRVSSQPVGIRMANGALQ
jgi:hypothetical protein